MNGGKTNMKTIKLQDDHRYKTYYSLGRDKGLNSQDSHKYAKQCVFYDKQEDIFMAKFSKKLDGKTAD
mgnify:CR=1 FL=1